MTNEQRNGSTTPFQVIYDRFLGMITDDMYMEWTKEQTIADLQNMLLNSIPRFKYPKFKIYDYNSEAEVKDVNDITISKGCFNFMLDGEEILILINLMLLEWINRQISDVNVTKMKYGSADFKLTSQANHLDKLVKLRQSYLLEDKGIQSLYNRRKVDSEGYVKPNFSGLGGSVYGD